MSQFTNLITSLVLGFTLLSQTVAPKLLSAISRPESLSLQRRRPRVKKDPAQERREKTFQLVWETVRDENFDPTFGGVDWNAVRARYAPRVARVRTDRELHNLLQLMLNELPQSHFAIVPPEAIPRIKRQRRTVEKTDAGEAEGAESLVDLEENESDNELAARMLNGVGVDVRILKGQVVITRVAGGGAADKAGLRPGFVIKSVDGLPLENITGRGGASVPVSPLIEMRTRQAVLVYYLGGEAGTDVRLTYDDGRNVAREIVLKRERLAGSLSSPIGNLPPFYTEFESKRLPGDIGYVRFSVFVPQVAEKFCRAIKSMRDAPGLVIDLRGNPGGVMGMASGMVGLMLERPGLIGVIRMRGGNIPIPAFPQRSSYKGRIVVLIDRLSASTAEVMAAALQESGRAVIVGERSAGFVLGADVKKLPTGALFEYARAGFKTSLGATLEGKGVRPDVEKTLDRERLLEGQDDQLAEAVRQIELKKVSAANNALPTPPPPPAPAPVIVKASPHPAPPAEAQRPGSGVDVKSAPDSRTFKSTPQAEQVIEKYVQAVGGHEAIERIKSRVSVGTCTLPFQGLTGKVVIYEQFPDKWSMELEMPEMGVMKIAFDGKRGWMEHPLMGFMEFNEKLIPALKREYDFHRAIKYKDLYAAINYKGTIDTAQGKINILELTSPEGFPEEEHFDAETGLLVYGGGTEFGDYRQVGGVKVPFLRRLPFAGLNIVIQLQQVSQDVPIKADAFSEPQSCFTAR